MMDVSVLQAVNTETDIQFLIETARKYHFYCTFALSCYSATLVEAFKDEDILVGAPIGFPSGGEMSEIKAFQAMTLYDVGCDEFDMVMNVGWLKSRQYGRVENDIKAVYEAIKDRPLKVIVEAIYLTDQELVDACKIIMNSGAEFIKTGTGWASKPTELRHIEIIAKTVGKKIKIKAAGGIKNYETVCKMHDMGVVRFGVSVKSGIEIVKEASSRQ
ncbi:MAG: deoxyribose-phosphate aldolase [Candidatus Atribacteria bacterium]|nr:deoxyribose-phosphate aldolase [Candidatus Atribacteria bacterium]